MKVVTTKEMKSLDQRAIDEYGVSSLSLMERAGEGVVKIIEETYGTMTGKNILIVVGTGNNGGDGLVVGRLLMQRGAKVTSHILTNIENLAGDALANFIRYRDLGGVFTTAPPSTLQNILKSIDSTELIIDAIFGTGLSRPIEGMISSIVEHINMHDTPVISIDIPSGLSGDTGEILGSAIQATQTIALALPKRGMFLNHGITHSGTISIADIGIPTSYIDDIPIETYLITGSCVYKHLPDRPHDAHKGTFGHAGIIAGSVGKTGAAVLASQAALRIGSGRVSLAIPATLNDIVETMLIEVMTEPIPDISARAFGLASVAPLIKFSNKKTALAIGPGIGTHIETIDAIIDLIPQLTIPCVLDADALNCLARNITVLDRAQTEIILTPHPGEMAKLLGCTNSDVCQDRLGTATKLSKKTGATVVLKGARTLVASPNQPVAICPTGNPGMATAGTGDALTGIIVGLISQGLSAYTAAITGVYLHGLAGDIATAPHNSIGMIASDLVTSIPEAIRTISTQATGSLGHHLPTHDVRSRA